MAIEKLPPIGAFVARTIPAVYEESMSFYELLSKVWAKLNELIGQLEGGTAQYIQQLMEKWLADGTLAQIIAGAFRWELVGSDSLEAKGSIYLKNDNNLFGRKADGTFTNIGTVQQNDIVQYGDFDSDVMWMVTSKYHSFRAPSSPSYQQLDPVTGAAVGVGRTILHQGNSSNHLVAFSVGDVTLHQNSNNTLTNLTNINGQFPPNSYTNLRYAIPRAGMYHFDITAKIKTQPPKAGYIRVVLSIMRGGQEITSDMQDMYYDPVSYATPFLSESFLYRLSKDDLVQVQLKPLNETITLEEGTKLYIYGLGDTIQN